jgi:hypothetical protein
MRSISGKYHRLAGHDRSVDWQSEIGFVYHKSTFKQLKTFTYQGEGWGLTHDGTRLIMSDGSPGLRVPRSAVVEGDRATDRPRVAGQSKI